MDSELRSRNTPWNPRLAHLRALAALLVLVFHAYHVFFGGWQPQPHATGIGWIVEGHTGVGLFFVLSGYLFMSIALGGQGPIAWGPFMRNRVLRVVPLYAVFFVVALSIGRDLFRPADLLYFLIPNLGDPPTSKTFLTGAAWTIGVEFAFYLVFPFLARAARAEGPAYLLKLGLLTLLLKAAAFSVAAQPVLMVYSTLLGRFDQFLIGMLAAQLLAGRAARGAPPLRVGPAGLLGAVLALGLALEILATQASYFLGQGLRLAWLAWPTLEALLWALLIVAYTHATLSLPRPLDRALAWCGEVSFSLYLWHAVVLHGLALAFKPRLGAWLQHMPWELAALLLTGLTLLLTGLVAHLSHQVIERPFLGLRGAYLKTPPPP